MAQLGLPELILVLRDLDGPKRELLETLATGRVYAAKLRKKLAEMEALPESLTGPALADELAAADALHDSLGASVWFYCESCLRNQTLPQSVRDAAQRVRDAILPELSELQRTYAVEAAAALARLDQFETLEPDLSQFPVAGGGTLADWVRAFLAQGKTIDQLLGRRGDVQATSSRRKATTLRAEAVGLLGRLREAIRDEARDNPQFAPDIEARLFGYHDELARLRSERRKSKQPPAASVLPEAAAPLA